MKFFVSLWLALLPLSGVLGTAVPSKYVLSSRQIPKRASRRFIRGLSPSSVSLEDYFNGTDLQWFGSIQVGTPPQNFTVVFDTGSFDLEIPGVSCTSCTNQNKFNGSASSSFQDLQSQSTITFATGVGVDPVVNNDYQLKLDGVRDTISVGGLAAPNISFFLITHPFNSDPFDGILGLGFTAGSFFQSLVNQGLPALFSLYLAPQGSEGAELTLGGIDSTKFNTAMQFAKVQANQDFWNVSSSSIAVNGQTATVLQAPQSLTFDSGTSNLVFPPDITEAIYGLISSDIKPNSAEPGTYGVACSEVPSLNASIDFTFTSTSGTLFNLTIPSSELSVGPFISNTSLCQTLINAQSGPAIVGASLLKHYYTTWDLGNQQLGFAAVNTVRCCILIH
ncbi:acid protease [Sistotremastrum niveocremeum HHB9708]|uniref:Acid protease n=1 Tax=Sistotremastrum niveocremeum HHB9708 TaxID=1314777 RepID=A0A165A3Q4_9AGAM|nr:acid protease [Sistotremastrum niveocremeum HHB9708]